MPDKSAYLKAMGIDVWQQRNKSSENADLAVASLTPHASAQISQPESITLPESLSQSESTLQPGSLSQQKPETAVTPLAKENITQIEETLKEAKHPIKVDSVVINNLDWPALEKQVSACLLCELAKTRSCALLGYGNKNASLMIIGDAPTEEDENNKQLFSGASGTLLSAMLKAMGFQRQDVYLTNTVKCKTQSNQPPSELQSTTCEDYLLRQIQLVQPKLILAMGNIAAQSLLKSKSTMTRLRGQLHYIDGVKAPVLVSYHPTYLLAAANEKRKAWQDLQLAMKALAS